MTTKKGSAAGVEDQPGPGVVDDPWDAPVPLGEAALTAMGDVLEHGGTQDVLEDTNYTKVKFVGMAMDTLDDQIKIGDEMVFTVKARCIGTADEASKQDGHVRHIVKMDVQSVVTA